MHNCGCSQIVNLGSVNGTPSTVPPKSRPCVRMATEELGVLPLTEIGWPTDVRIFDEGEPSSGLFVRYVYSAQGGGPPVSFEYAIDDPVLPTEWETFATIITTWAHVQERIDAAINGTQTHIRIPSSLQAIPMTPLQINGKSEIRLTGFSWTVGTTYTGGASTGALIEIEDSEKIYIDNFICTTSGGARRGITMQNSTDVFVENCTVDGCTDSIVFLGDCHRVKVINWSAPNCHDEASLPGDYGYGIYLDGGDHNSSHIQVIDSSFQLIASAQHGIRMENPTFTKIDNVQIIRDGSKRGLWTYGSRSVQLSNLDIDGGGLLIGLSGPDYINGLSTHYVEGVRVDNVTIRNSPSTDDVCRVMCAPGARDILFRYIHGINNNGVLIQTGWRDDVPSGPGSYVAPFTGTFSEDINWLASTLTVDGDPATSADWEVSTDWSLAEQAAQNIGPFGSEVFQQYIVLRDVDGLVWTDGGTMTAAGGFEQNLRGTAEGGADVTEVDCDHSQSSADTIELA